MRRDLFGIGCAEKANPEGEAEVCRGSTEQSGAAPSSLLGFWDEAIGRGRSGSKVRQVSGLITY